MNLTNNKWISIIAIILGLIIVVCPFLGVSDSKNIIGISILLLGIFMIFSGYSNLDYDKTKSIVYMVLGVIFIIFSLGLIFVLGVFVALESILIYIAGIFLAIVGLVILIQNRNAKIGFWIGIIGVVLGVIYLVIGTYMRDSNILSFLIGLWLIITGVLKLIDN